MPVGGRVAGKATGIISGNYDGEYGLVVLQLRAFLQREKRCSRPYIFYHSGNPLRNK